jgi:hypothetical protein
MPRAQKLSVSSRNLIWFAIVLVVGVVVGLVAGWKVGLIAAVIALAVSEIVERSAPRKRLAATQP